MYQPGTRVGAILSIQDNVAKFLGYGIYEGDEKPPFLPFENPRIKLDSGDIVWGIECWWGPEDQIRKKLENITIQNIKLVRDDNGEVCEVKELT